VAVPILSWVAAVEVGAGAGAGAGFAAAAGAAAGAGAAAPEPDCGLLQEPRMTAVKAMHTATIRNRFFIFFSFFDMIFIPLLN